MYALLDRKNLVVLSLGLTREEAFNPANWNNHAVPEDDYSPAPFYGSKLDKETETFVQVEIEEVRKMRNALLIATDWRATVDYPNIDQGAWLEYRQALRDIPQNYPEMVAVVFPTEPS
jgi:hypothetical protein